jgi:cupin 2 domain-containing protein
VTAVRRGRLRPPEDAPEFGEVVESVVELSGIGVEQILSGELAGPVDYRQDHDEWVVVLAGGAELEVAGSPVSLSTGEWVVLPRGVPHRLVSTRAETSWLALRVPPDPA